MSKKNKPPVIPPSALQEFAARMRAREAGDRPGPEDDEAVYGRCNKFGYMGAYQFGMARLADVGLTERLVWKRPNDMRNDAFAWINGWSKVRFLADRSFQDALFTGHVLDLVNWVYRSKLDSFIGEWLSAVMSNYLQKNRSVPAMTATPVRPSEDCVVTLSGMVAVCHLLGPGGLQELLWNRRDKTDGFGTKASHYLKHFEGIF